MINLYARVGTIAESVAWTPTQLDKQVEHAVDRKSICAATARSSARSSAWRPRTSCGT